METIDIQNKSFVVRWLYVKRGDTISYQLKPLKRSVDVGIYKRQSTLHDEVFERGNGTPEKNGSSNGHGISSGNVHIAPDTRTLIDYALNRSTSSFEEATRHRSKSIADVQHHAQEIPLEVKLTAQGFTLVQRLGTIAGNELIEGTIQADEDGYYAFILDNTASKTVKKKILVSVANKTQDMHAPVHRARSHLIRVKQGRILQGYLLKKRRKKLQGFTKRYFKLDFKYKTLSYYLNEHNNVCRGEVVITLASVSANKMTRLIVIDSGMEIWVLKARDESTWQEWIMALQDCFKDAVAPKKEIAEPSLDPSNFRASLQLIEQKLESCKLQSLSYFPPTSEFKVSKSSHNSGGTPSPVSRSPSFSSLSNIFTKHKTGSQETVNKPKDTAQDFPTQSSPYEHDLYKKLEEVEKLVRYWADYSMGVLQSTARSTSPSIMSENEYYDAIDDNLDDDTNEGVIMLNDEEGVNALLLSQSPFTEKNEDNYNDDDDSSKFDPTIVQTSQPVSAGGDLYPLPWNHKVHRRDDVPAASTQPPSLFSFLRKNVGKDLTSISMPITSNEPITILQMLSETFEYTELLNKAASTDDDIDRLALVAAFACSYLSMHRHKVRALRKPFNPLLGETFELVREDKGVRLIAEKVSHKPQIFAFHVDHSQWEVSYVVSPVQKFWGKSIEFFNEGQIKVVMKSSGECYVWSQPTTILKNLFAGERYIEPTNQMEIVSSLDCKARVTFKAGGMFSGRSEDVSIALHKGNKQLGLLKGQWTNSIVNTKTGQTIWKTGELVPEPEKKYGFTKFTADLNQITEIEQGHIPPTDSRLRPDLRLYEDGNVEEAEALKLKLEQDQRERRQNSQDVKPQYFERVSDTQWKFIEGQRGYWERRRIKEWDGLVPLW